MMIDVDYEREETRGDYNRDEKVHCCTIHHLSNSTLFPSIPHFLLDNTRLLALLDLHHAARLVDRASHQSL